MKSSISKPARCVSSFVHHISAYIRVEIDVSTSLPSSAATRSVRRLCLIIHRPHFQPTRRIFRVFSTFVLQVPSFGRSFRMSMASTPMACQFLPMIFASPTSFDSLFTIYRYRGNSDMQLERISVYYNATGGMSSAPLGSSFPRSPTCFLQQTSTCLVPS